MSRLTIFHQISDQLINYSSRITRKNNLNLNDEANFAEDIAAEILSEVFMLTLVNADDARSNVAAIDLTDIKNKVRVQVYFGVFLFRQIRERFTLNYGIPTEKIKVIKGYFSETFDLDSL